MRMWHKDLIPYLSNQRLIGMHGEIHKHRHNFVKKHSVAGRVYPIVQIEPWAMQIRHDELVLEMLQRGIHHKSPYSLPDLSYLNNEQRFVKVNYYVDVQVLIERGELINGDSNEKI